MAVERLFRLPTTDSSGFLTGNLWNLQVLLAPAKIDLNGV